MTNAIVIPVAILLAPTYNHLDKCNEILASQLCTIHNLRYYQQHMAAMRAAIAAGQLDAFATTFYAQQSNPEP